MDNSGLCSKKEFIKAINKIGITGLSEQNLEDLFEVYDVDGSGELDYKEFVGIIFNNASMGAGKKGASAKKPQQGGAEPRSQGAKEAGTKQDFLDDDQVQDILLRIRDKLAARGVRGIASIAKNFA
ncbi:MAG: EF-hand domain-containing protein [archaeon]|nr:EF-hand domain-containing protein [archaeon]